MSNRVSEPVHRWLDEAGTAMGGRPSERRDVLMELETTILDNIDERVAEGQVPTDAVQDVLDAMGDPAEVGGSFMPQRPLLAPHQTRPFLVNLVALFAVHFLLVIGATASGSAFSLPPLHIDPIANPKALVGLLARALQTLLFDAGLLLCAFALLPRVGKLFRVKSIRPDRRRCLDGAFFLGLVMIVINFLRDDMLALYVPTPIGTAQVPLVGPGIVNNLVWFNVWLGLAITREVLYAWRGERRSSLALDVVSNAVGVMCLLRIVASKALVDLSGAHEALGPTADSLGSMLNTALTLISLAAAAILTARLVRRGFRLASLKN